MQWLIKLNWHGGHKQGSSMSKKQPCSASNSPAKQPLEQEVLGPHNAVDRLVRCVADGTHWVGLGSLLGSALKALGLASNVHRCLHACKAGWPDIMLVSSAV